MAIPRIKPLRIGGSRPLRRQIYARRSALQDIFPSDVGDMFGGDLASWALAHPVPNIRDDRDAPLWWVRDNDGRRIDLGLK
jgi:hypothetical protein